VLALLKTDNITDRERRTEIDNLLAYKLNDDEFNSITVMAKQLVDFEPQGEEDQDMGEEVVQVNLEFERDESGESEEEEAEGEERKEEEDQEEFLRSKAKAE